MIPNSSSIFMDVYIAKKNHGKCSFCENDILPGQKYERRAIPAWLDCEGDVDEYGRNIYVSLPREERKWWIMKFHYDCGLEAFI